jgi:16S rRNA (guanine527-N7)-methyltransferase
MQSGNDAANPPRLPADLEEDYAQFRSRLLERSIVSESAIASLREYGLLLYERAASLSLISKGDRSQIFTRHVLDSLNALALFPEPPRSAWDVGSGGGLPGIPLAIAWPETRVVLLESRERKAGFLEQAVRALRLANAQVVCGRLEEIAPPPEAERAEAVFVRALGNLGDLLTDSSRLAIAGASWVYFLGDREPDQVLGSDERRLWQAEVESGSFGGRLLRGRFRGGAAEG